VSAYVGRAGEENGRGRRGKRSRKMERRRQGRKRMKQLVLKGGFREGTQENTLWYGEIYKMRKIDRKLLECQS